MSPPSTSAHILVADLVGHFLCRLRISDMPKMVPSADQRVGVSECSGRVLVFRPLGIPGGRAILDDDFDRLALVFLEEVVERASGSGPDTAPTSTTAPRDAHDHGE